MPSHDLLCPDFASNDCIASIFAVDIIFLVFALTLLLSAWHASTMPHPIPSRLRLVRYMVGAEILMSNLIFVIQLSVGRTILWYTCIQVYRILSEMTYVQFVSNVMDTAYKTAKQIKERKVLPTLRLVLFAIIIFFHSTEIVLTLAMWDGEYIASSSATYDNIFWWSLDLAVFFGLFHIMYSVRSHVKTLPDGSATSLFQQAQNKLMILEVALVVRGATKLVPEIAWTDIFKFAWPGCPVKTYTCAHLSLLLTCAFMRWLIIFYHSYVPSKKNCDQVLDEEL
eukprot:1475_1